jgi:hypothetical protein
MMISVTGMILLIDLPKDSMNQSLFLCTKLLNLFKILQQKRNIEICFCWSKEKIGQNNFLRAFFYHLKIYGKNLYAIKKKVLAYIEAGARIINSIGKIL